jgi:hypothetical protein
MKIATLAFVLCGFFSSCSAQKAENTGPDGLVKTGVKPVVLVELFTSEGCSSCPPADKALAFLAKQELPDAEIVTLALHVDYWDSPAWRDKFSSHAYSGRQEEYSRRFKLGSNYTPQMVVDGQTEFVGSDLRKATEAIGQALKAKKGRIDVVSDKGKLSIKVADLPGHEKASVFVAISEDGLVSNVGGGENDGSRLEHWSVVRKLTEAGKIEAGAESSNLGADLKLDQDWKMENLNFVVFVQEDKSRKIIAVGKAVR